MLQRKQKISAIPFFFKTNNSKFEYPLNGVVSNSIKYKVFQLFVDLNKNILSKVDIEI